MDFVGHPHTASGRVVLQQPHSIPTMSEKLSPPAAMAPDYDTECCRFSHSGVRKSLRWRRFVLPTLLSLVGLLLLFGVSTFLMKAFGCGDPLELGAALIKRASGDSSSGDDSSFVSHKYYVIIIVVGLFLVVIAGIALSAWCCKGSFQNPLCCPCYLCACCGGLACLECIGCGLCAEGLEEM